MRDKLWPLPTLGVILAVVVGVLMPALDAAVDDRLGRVIDSIVFNGDSSAARTVLSVVASSLMTVTSLTFSLTVVTLQLASSQFSPRLLRTFTQDLFVQVTLTIFLATFTFALTVLRAVRSADDGHPSFVPRLAVTLAFLLALTSVVSLVLFLAHLTRQIRVETMLLRVQRDATQTMERNLTPRADPRLPAPDPPATAQRVWSTGSGFVTGVDHDELVDLAASEEVMVSIDRHPGAFVVERTPLGRLWRRDHRELDPETLERLSGQVAGAVRLGPERTAAEDIGLGLRQISDIVVMALSPGVNDPTTAVHGLARASVLLAGLCACHLGPLVLDDGDGRPVVVLHRPDFRELLELTVGEARTYGASDVTVLGRLYELLTDLAWHVDDGQEGPILDQLRRLDATVAQQDFDEADTTRLAGLSETVRRTLTELCRRPESPPPGAADAGVSRPG